MTKHAELPHVDILQLQYPRWDVTRVLRRQLPRRCRRKVIFTAKEWEGQVWSVAHIYDHSIDPGAWTWEKWNQQWSAPLLDKPRRYDNKIVARATLHPEFIAFLAMTA